MMLFWASKSENVFKDYSSSGEKNQKWVIVSVSETEGLTIKRFGETDCEC